MIVIRIACAVCLALSVAGCASDSPIRTSSPTLRMLRGEIKANEFADAVTAENENQRAQDEFEANRIPSRAFNTKTNRYETAPKSAQIVWNEDEKRWEFTPPKDPKEAVTENK